MVAQYHVRFKRHPHFSWSLVTKLHGLRGVLKSKEMGSQWDFWHEYWDANGCAEAKFHTFPGLQLIWNICLHWPFQVWLAHRSSSPSCILLWLSVGDMEHSQSTGKKKTPFPFQRLWFHYWAPTWKLKTLKFSRIHFGICYHTKGEREKGTAEIKMSMPMLTFQFNRHPPTFLHSRML